MKTTVKLVKFTALGEKTEVLLNTEKNLFRRKVPKRGYRILFMSDFKFQRKSQSAPETCRSSGNRPQHS